MSIRTILFFALILHSCFTFGGKEVFHSDKFGQNEGVWRLTSDPVVRDHANYHNTQCFSPDGRYICYTHWGGEKGGGIKGTATIHLFDFATDTDRLVGQGVFPRWANAHNWLFYVSYKARPESVAKNGSCVMWLDLTTGRHEMLVDGPEALGETDSKDRWIYGALRFRGRSPEYEEVRIPLTWGTQVERMPQVVGAQRMPNPSHALFFTRRDHNLDPFEATRYWYDLDGTHQRIGAPTIQKCHMSWLGSGEYLLFGNGLVRGRKWSEPFPSNIHILASVTVGDISPCGLSGRYVCGDSTIADLRSGDGWPFIEPLSIICYPARIADDSGIYDADPKGSPDGTKVCFVSNYPLKDGPVTRITETVSSKANRVPVESTAGFPDSGHINVYREVIAYQSKTATSFEGITRRALDTAGLNLRPGRIVTSFEARCLTDAQWQRVGRPAPTLQKSIGRSDSLLIRQRQTDVYSVIVRKPDRPHLRRVGDGLQLIPGENHNETAGYRLLCNGRSVADQPIQPSAIFHIDQPGRCTAIAVEWSGVESEPSVPLTIERPIDGHVLNETPEDFSWTSDRWNEDHTLREIVHLHDGVIRREWYSQGQIDRCHDLNSEGKAIRRTQYTKGRIAVREYFHRDGHRVSREVFDSDGFITETIRYQTDDEGAERETDHWWFERGMPVRERRGQKDYVKRGDRFGRLSENGEFIDTPRAAISD